VANKLVLLSDVHLLWENPKSRLDNLPQTQFKKLEFVYNWAKNNNAIVIQAGDLVHKPRSWYLLPLIVKFFMTWKRKGVDTLMVRGQHDYYYYSEASGPATVIGALMEAELLHLIPNDKPMVLNLEGKRVNLYGASFGEKVPVPEKFSPSNILVVHREISDTSLFDGHRYFSHKGFLKRHKNYKVILCADIHRKFKATILSTSEKIPRYIVNTGPMLRASATTYNFDHQPGFYIWTPKTRKLQWKNIPVEPADEVLTRAHIEAQEAEDKRMAEFTLKLTTRMKEGDEEVGENYTFKGGLDSYMEEHRVGKDVADMISGALQEVDINDL